MPLDWPEIRLIEYVLLEVASLLLLVELVLAVLPIWIRLKEECL